MTDLLLILGLGLMALSVVLALVDLAQTRPPRAAAGAFVLGLLLAVLAAWLDPDPFRVQDIARSWSHLIGGAYLR